MPRLNELSPINDRDIPKGTIKPAGTLPRRIGLNSPAPRRAALKLFLPVLIPIGLVGYALTQKPQPPSVPSTRFAEPSPLAYEPPPRSPHWGRFITFAADGTVSFTEKPEVVEAVLDNGELIHAIRVLGKPYDPAMRRIGNKDINLGAVNPKENNIEIPGGEWLRRVNAQGTPVRDPKGEMIEYEARKAVIAQPQPQNKAKS